MQKARIEGILLARVFKGNNKTHFRRVLSYDHFGNIKSDSLYGNLTGKDPLNEEVYVKRYRSTEDGWNLPREENDGRKKIICTYYPTSNLLKLRITKTDTIVKREYFDYDDNGMLKLEIVDDGVTEDIWDITGVTERRAKTVAYSLNPIGLPFRIVDYYYDPEKGNDFVIKKTANFYYPDGKLKEQWHYGKTNKIAYKLCWEYDALGNVTNYTDALGQITQCRYENGNKVYEKGPRTDVHKEFKYDFANRLIQEKEVWADHREFVTTHQYNLLNQRIATIDHDGNVTTFKYDELGHLTETHFPDSHDLNGQSITVKTLNKYDAMGNIVSSTDANGHCIKKYYTVRGQPYRIEYPDGSVEQKEYTLEGWLKKEIAKNGTSTGYAHDAFGRVIRTEIRDAQDNLLKQTSATYNTFRLLSETDENDLTTYYEYDYAGRKICATTAGHKTYYEYDNLGNEFKVSEEIDGHRRCTIRDYDNLGRVLEERIEDQLGNIYSKEQYQYDESGNRIRHTIFTEAGTADTTTEYTPHGKPKTITDALGHTTHITYNYNFPYQGKSILQEMKTDPLGNQQESLYNIQGKVFQVNCYNPFGLLTQAESYEYDAKGQRISSKINILPSSKQIITTWEYDCMGNSIACVEGQGTPEQKTTRTQYNRYGEKEKIIKPDGVTLQFEYDSLNRLIDLCSSDSSIHYTYEYDLKDHPIRVEDLVHHKQTQRLYDGYGCLRTETLGTGHTLTYTYDSLNRPLTLTLPDQSQINYCYDAHHLKAIERIKDQQVAYRHLYLKYDLCGNPVEEELIGQAGKLTKQQRPLAAYHPSNS